MALLDERNQDDRSAALDENDENSGEQDVADDMGPAQSESEADEEEDSDENEEREGEEEGVF